MATTAAAPRRVERSGSFDVGPIFFIGAVVVLAILVIVPIGWLLLISVQTPDTGVLTLHNYVEAFTKSIYLRPIINSFILAVSVATIAALLGTPLAWLIARSDMPGRKALRALITAAFVTPSFIGAEAWILLAAPNSGWINRAIASFTHADHGPLNIFSLGGAIFVMALYNVPYTFTFVAGGLELLPVELEDASSTLGASAWRTMRSITLPLVMPAIIAGFIMSFLEALAEFGTPAFFLIPARAQVVTTQLYLFFQFPVRTELAAAYAMPLLAVTLLLLLVQRRILGRRKYTMVGGKGGRRRLIALGAWRWPLLGIALLVPLCSVVLPYLALLATSLSRIWSTGPVPGNLTLYWYQWAIFENAGDAARDLPQPRVRRGCRDGRDDHRASDRIHREPQAVPGRAGARHRVHGAVRRAGHRAGDRHLRRVLAPAAAAVRYRDDPDHRVHDALSADRVLAT